MKVTNYVLKIKGENSLLSNNDSITSVLSDVKMFYTFDKAQTHTIQLNQAFEEANREDRYEVRLLEIEIV